MPAFKPAFPGRLTVLLLCTAFLVQPTIIRADDADPTLQPRCGLPFQGNAVLQQKIPLPVWGKTLPKAKVTVSFFGQTRSTTADANGAWRVTLAPMNATRLDSVNQVPQGKTMRIVCEKDGAQAVEEIRNIVLGEVWLCAGQSNMAGKMRTNKAKHFPVDSIEKANYPALRQMLSPQDQPWLVCSPETAPEFKKVCFFFGRRLQQDILVPVGLINAAIGGSRIEAWLNRKPYDYGKHYGKLIQPLEGYGLRGVLWYQGESNALDKRAYAPKLSALILGWRESWKQASTKEAESPQGEFSVYFVQLPGIGKSPTDSPACGDGRAEIRQAQFETLSLKNTGMAITIDIGAVKEHPPNKYDTGVRLAHLALHRDYRQSKLVPSGPLYRSHEIEESAIRIRFDYTGSGLMVAQKNGFLPPEPSPKAKVKWFSIKDKSGAWHWANAQIDGSDLIVSSPQVKHPVAVRYAYTNHPTAPLVYNREGLPMGPFSTNGYGEEDTAKEGEQKESDK